MTDLVKRIRSQADISSRSGQRAALMQIADELAELRIKVESLHYVAAAVEKSPPDRFTYQRALGQTEAYRNVLDLMLDLMGE